MPATPSAFARSLTTETAFDVLAVARKLQAAGKDVIALQIGDSPFPSTKSAVRADPKAFAPASFVDRRVPTCIIPPNSFALARTVEYFRIPRDVLVICLGKSTYARCGIIVNVTPLEPEWEGQVTIEISNTTPLPARIYANEGICQFLFLKGDTPPEVSYADRSGKYMRQRGVALPRL